MATVVLWVFIAAVSCTRDVDQARDELEPPLRPVVRGDRMPPFSALTLDGDTVRLADVQGRMIVLHVWPTTCASCSSHLPFLRDAYNQWAEEGLEIVSLSLDAPGEDSTVQAAIRRENVQHVVLRDPGRTIWGAIGMRGYPPILVIDDTGTIVLVQQAPVLEGRKPAWLVVVERQFVPLR